MGRELRRKQAKKEGKSLQKEIQKEEHQIKNLLIITMVMVFVVSITYLISAVFITKELSGISNDTNTNKTENTAPNTILAVETFKQKEEEYYVYFYDYEAENQEISSVVNKIKDINVYRVNTSSALNKNYVSENGNRNAKKIENLKVKSSTVVKVSGDTIVAYYEDAEIISNLK